MIGMLLGAKDVDDVICYFKTVGKRGAISLNAQEIGICKYKEMLMATVGST
jgi:hypothetical protein